MNIFDKSLFLFLFRSSVLNTEMNILDATEDTQIGKKPHIYSFSPRFGHSLSYAGIKKTNVDDMIEPTVRTFIRY